LSPVAARRSCARRYALWALLLLPALAACAASQQQSAPGATGTSGTPGLSGTPPLGTSPAPPAVTSHGTQRADTVLQALLERMVHGFGGDVGVYVHHLGSGATAAVHADEVFPTASMIKVPLLLTLFQQVEQGTHDLDARLPFPDTLTYAFTEATDVVGYMQPGDSLPLSQTAFLMLSTSDNLASLWIQALVGGGAAVNEWLASHGFAETRVNSRTPGREEARTRFGWGQTTPREMAAALVMIREGRAVSPRASERMYRMLTNSYWDGEALSQIPPHVQAASKQGFVSRSRSEVLLVNAPSGDFVLAIITNNQADTSADWDNEGFRLIRAVTRAVYQHFEPADPWRPRGR
jgi:beta-lactamase class A